uniref:Dynein beta chain, ciliary n=3 Tax=Cacopsylla melanoneura TaxID=428564 RepID=A0A8D9BW96_9HEMI
MIKCILCFSPVGSTLRVRSRKFPGLVNCTQIDWFHEWPQEALESVSLNFLNSVEALAEGLRKPCAVFMAFVHSSVNQISTSFLLNERRYNYTTPKSFLEQIDLYAKLLTTKFDDNKSGIVRFQNGLQKLVSCSEQVAGLKADLDIKNKEVAEKTTKANELIKVVGKEQAKVSTEKSFVGNEETKVRAIEEDVGIKQKICTEDLEKAEPALVAAQEALDTLDKNNLTELKALKAPPQGVMSVCDAVAVLMASKKGKIPKDLGWKSSQAMMSSVDVFLTNLKKYDKENIHPEIVKYVTKEYLTKDYFKPDIIRGQSSAAAGLCAWVINIVTFYNVWTFVEPKRHALLAANAELAAAQSKLGELKARIAFLEETLKDLTDKFDFAVKEKLKCQTQAEECAEKIDLADRLVNGLASENVRWRESVLILQQSSLTLPGDILLVTAFVSYVGCFTRSYRLDLLDKFWLPTIKKSKPEIPMTADLDPLTMLTDDATIAFWNNEGLPNDRMSTENATILVNSQRWPLMIDPQLQGIKWIKSRYAKNLTIIRLGQKKVMDLIEKAVMTGKVLLIENIGEYVDPVLDNLIGRNLIRKGKVVKIGEKEIDYHPDFKLILHTKLANPHYKPEMQAQTTLINFTVTRDGLEDQLLAEVVKFERPDLETLKADLTKEQNMFKITLKDLEDDLLMRLSSSGGDVLSDKNLVLNLEQSKMTAKEIEMKVKEGKKTAKRIDEAREQYRPAAERASIIYFIMNELFKINPIYQFSLKAFTMVFHSAMSKASQSDELKVRVNNLVDSITFMTFQYTSRGLFERDKLIFMAQMTIQIAMIKKDIARDELDFLLRFPVTPGVSSPVDFLTNTLWGGIRSLSNLEEFKGLDKDIESGAKRWKKFVEGDTPERDKYPGEWKSKSALQRLCLMRCLRPDRMTYAVRVFVEEKMGEQYTNARTVEFEQSYKESSCTVPIFFILSPGVDPTRDVETVGIKMGFTTDKKNLHNVSLGQGQEVVAEDTITIASTEGHWAILQNVHLVKNWLPTLDKKMEASFENPHKDYRLFISAEPAANPEYHIIPQGVLDSSIKITNEPPTGMKANIHKALDNFSQQDLEKSSKEAEFKSILFALCYFHAVVAERRKFGPQGWNKSYPFNVGDLTISSLVLYNYLEANQNVPWEDLRFLFGEIMYGGHITDDWDRKLCKTYLEEYIGPQLLDGELKLAPGFSAPPNSDYVGYHQYIDETLPSESPILYGLHPNAEIGFLTTQAENVFKIIFELQPRDSAASQGSGVTREEKVRQVLDEILDKCPDPFNIQEMMSRVEDRTPYIIVAFQECERMNILMTEIKRSLKELNLGLKGELTITTPMEALEYSIFMDTVPPSWEKRAYPSMLGLGGWFADLQLRLKELEAWVGDFQLPSSVWLAGFFNPQSFLTAIMQSTARKNEWPLDKMCLSCDVTKKQREDFTTPPRDGAYVNGLFMEGARWDINLGVISEAKLKELFPLMPVMYIKAITQDKQDLRNMYECPVYKTRQRGPNYVWTFNLKTKEKPAKWTMAGVAILLCT